MFPARRNFILSVILFAVVTGTISLTVELAFRYIEHQQHLTKHRAVFRPNPYGTGSYRLKAKFDFVSQVEGVKVRVTTNSLGITGPEVLQQSKNDKQRIAFVGDSFTFGSWATDYDHSFVGALQNILSADKYEVLNFGVGGYALDDIELIVREVFINFSPGR